MAVEIPVYVDITSGFDYAASQIPREMPKLERAISKNVLNIPVYMRGGYKTVQDALLSTTVTAKDLKQVLADISYQFERQAQFEADKTRTSEKVENLAKAYGLVEQRLTGVYNEANSASLMLQNSIIKVNAKLKDLRSQLAMAAPGSDAFNKINYQINIQEQRLLAITRQLEMYRVAGSRAGAQVSSSMQGAANTMLAQTGLLSRLTGLMGTYLSVAQLGRFVKQIRDVTGELEYQRVALGHLLQDEEYGAELFERIKAAAVESPFRITQLVTYTKQLAAYRIEQENLFDTTKRLADISAGLGVDMNRLILAYGQVRAASVLRGQELRQFTEAGIPLVELLAEKFEELKGEAISTADVFKLISERAVPFSMIADIFEDLTDKGGMFYKMQEEQAKTLKGRWEKLKDAYDIALQSIGDSESFQRANDVVLGALSMLAKYLRVIPKAINGITASFLSYLVVSKAVALWNNRNAISESKIANQMVRRAFLSGKLTLAEAIRARQSIALAKAEGRLAVATNGVSRAMAKLNIALIKNPWVAAVAAVVGLVVAFTSFKKKADETASSMHDIENAIEGMSQANKAHAKIDGLIDRYERLSSKAERSADETLKLTKTTSRLKEELPGAIDVIDNQNLSLEEQARLLREINDAELERQRKDKEDELDRAETRLKTLQGDMQSAEQEYSRLQKMYLDAKARAEKGAAAINAEYAGTQTRTTTQKELDRAEAQAEESATAAHDAMSSIEQEITKLTTKITRLRNQLYPEEAKKARAEWQNLLIDASKYTSEGVTKELFPSTDVESWNSLGEAVGKLKKQFKEAKTTYEGLVNAVREAGNLVRPTLVKERDAAKDTVDAWQLLDKVLGGLLSTDKPSGTDNRLSQLKSDISELTNAYKKFKELTKYKGEQEALIDLDAMFPQLKGWTPTFDSLIDKLNNMLADVREKLARSPKSKTLLDMQRTLETEISNLKFDELKDGIERQLSRLSEEIKRSETARNFYKDIFDLTGDESLATSMSIEVYGGIGDEFKERLQKQLNTVLSNIDADADMAKAFGEQDFGYILDHLSEIPEKWHKEIKDLADAQQKFSADQIKTWLNELKRAKTYSEERIQIARTTQQRISEINASNLADEEKKSLVAQYARKEAEDVAKLQYEAFKDSPMYVQMFSDLDNATQGMLQSMRNRITELMESWKGFDPVQLKEMQSRLQEIDAQLAKKNPFKVLSDSIKRYNELMDEGRSMRGDELKLVSADANLKQQQDALELAVSERDAKRATYDYAVETYGANSAAAIVAKQNLDVADKAAVAQGEVTDKAKESADEAARHASEWKEIQKNVAIARGEIAGYASVISDLGGAIEKAMSVFVSDNAAEYARRSAEALGTFADAIMDVAESAARATLGDVAGALQSGTQGILGMVSAGIQLSDLIAKIKLDKWNDQMSEQDKIIQSLEHSYDRLSRAIERSFGSDYLYNYNEAMDILLAQQAAYLKQAEIQADVAQNASRKSDRETAAEQEKQLRQRAADVDTQISDLREKMQEFYAGTSLTAAAEAFADAWLDAYRQFGSTTDAIKEKMEDMINNLIVKSSLAKVAETVLQPFYDAISEAARSHTLIEDVPALIGMLQGKTAELNNSLNAMGQILRASGINLRGTVGNLSGISRDIASASEESILALAAGINTQNFYMSYVPTISADLKMIAEIMTAGSGQVTSTTVTPEGAVMPSIQEMVYDHLPNIDRNLSEIYRLVSNVIKPRGTSAPYYIATDV